MAQPIHDVGSALRLVHRLFHGDLRGRQIRRFVAQDALGSLGVGQHCSQRLVEFMGDAGGKFAQGVESRDLPQPQQFLGAAAVGPLTQQSARGEQQHRYQQRPAQHHAPG